MTDEEIIEAGARAIINLGILRYPVPTVPDDSSAGDWILARDMARAALAVFRPLLAEQCAKIADDDRKFMYRGQESAASNVRIAAAIRQSVKAEDQP